MDVVERKHRQAMGELQSEVTHSLFIHTFTPSPSPMDTHALPPIPSQVNQLASLKEEASQRAKQFDAERADHATKVTEAQEAVGQLQLKLSPLPAALDQAKERKAAVEAELERSATEPNPYRCRCRPRSVALLVCWSVGLWMAYTHTLYSSHILLPLLPLLLAHQINERTHGWMDGWMDG